MPKIVEDIEEVYQRATGKKAKHYDTPGWPGKTLDKNTGEMVDIDNYRSLVGKLLYFSVKVAPELSNATRDLAGHMSNPGADHWKAAERLVGYVSKKKIGLTYRQPRELRSISYCDSDYAKDTNDRKSISGRINTLGGMITSWSSKKQNTVTLSSTEAEYLSMASCCQEVKFTNMLLKELLGDFKPAIVYEDNVGAIFLVKNQQVGVRTKHIDVCHHFICNMESNNELDVCFCRSKSNPSDICTKNVSVKLFEKHAKDIEDGTLQCWREDVKTNTTTRSLDAQNGQQ